VWPGLSISVCSSSYRLFTDAFFPATRCPAQQALSVVPGQHPSQATDEAFTCYPVLLPSCKHHSNTHNNGSHEIAVHVTLEQPPTAPHINPANCCVVQHADKETLQGLQSLCTQGSKGSRTGFVTELACHPVPLLELRWSAACLDGEQAHAQHRTPLMWQACWATILYTVQDGGHPALLSTLDSSCSTQRLPKAAHFCEAC
jgi:hypothetical protein